MISRTDAHDDVTEFERAWDDPRHTRAVQPATDINQVLRQRYDTSEPLVFTRAMLWDLEQRKARDPGIYIPMSSARAATGAGRSRPPATGPSSWPGSRNSACGCAQTSTAWSSSAPTWTTTGRP
jgi:hypothetical protein